MHHILRRKLVTQRVARIALAVLEDRAMLTTDLGVKLARRQLEVADRDARSALNLTFCATGQK